MNFFAAHIINFFRGRGPHLSNKFLPLQYYPLKQRKGGEGVFYNYQVKLELVAFPVLQHI